MKEGIKNNLTINGEEFLSYLKDRNSYLVYPNMDSFLFFVTALYLNGCISKVSLNDYIKLIKKGYLNKFYNDKFYGGREMMDKIKSIIDSNEVNISNLEINFVDIYQELKGRDIISFENYTKQIFEFILSFYNITHYTFTNIVFVSKFLSDSVINFFHGFMEKYIDDVKSDARYPYSEYDTNSFHVDEEFKQKLYEYGFGADIKKILKVKKNA